MATASIGTEWVAALNRAMRRMAEAFRTMADACRRACRALGAALRRLLPDPHRHVALRVQRRAERRRLALMLRQQRRARQFQRRMVVTP